MYSHTIYTSRDDTHKKLCYSHHHRLFSAAKSGRFLSRLYIDPVCMFSEVLFSVIVTYYPDIKMLRLPHITFKWGRRIRQSGAKIIFTFTFCLFTKEYILLLHITYCTYTNLSSQNSRPCVSFFNLFNTLFDSFKKFRFNINSNIWCYVFCCIQFYPLLIITHCILNL